jgi:uncharacterized membrane protein
MIEHLFCYCPSSDAEGVAKNLSPSPKQDVALWRLRAMRSHLPSLLAATARSVVMVMLAMLLILVLLPSLAAMAAGAG